MSLYRRFLHALDNHGLRALYPPPPPTPGPAYTPGDRHPFDVAHSVDTSGHIPGEALATNSTADLYNTAYYAISPSSLMEALAACPVAPGETTFVDLGCGKGRPLLVAAQLGFAQILGVEISPELADIARVNASPNPAIKVLTQDAATVRYPAGPLLIFLYHPFLAPVLRRTLKNLIAQHAREPRPIHILFANPSYERLLGRFAQLTLIWTRSFLLSPEDAAADRHGVIGERYSLYGVC